MKNIVFSVKRENVSKNTAILLKLHFCCFLSGLDRVLFKAGARVSLIFQQLFSQIPKTNSWCFYYSSFLDAFDLFFLILFPPFLRQIEHDS